MFKGLIRGGLLFLLLVGNVEAQSSVSFLPNGSLTGVTSTGTSTVFSTPILLPDGSVSSPGLAFAGMPNTGLWRNGTTPTFSYNGSASFAFSNGGVQMLGSSPTLWFGVLADVALTRDAANTLALRNGTAAQTFNIYNTYTDASNYERGSIGWSGNTFAITTTAAGSGTLRNFQFTPGGGQVIVTGHVRPGADDTYDLGLFSTTRLWANLGLTRSIQGSKSKSLTDAGAAVSIWRIAVPTNGYAGGKVIFTANSTDGTDRLTTTGEVTFAGADTAGTVTCGIGTPYGLVTAYRRANTLVCTFTAVTSTTNCDIQVTCTDNLAGVQTMAIESRLDMPAPNTVTPQ